MPQCDTCQRTYHWNCLTDLNACSHIARQDAENSEDWHCPACNELLLANPDLKTYVDSYENADTSTQLNAQSCQKTKKLTI